MKTEAATERGNNAWRLVQAGLNATELAEALEVTRQSALCRIRTIKRSLRGKSPSTASAASRSTADATPTPAETLGIGQ